MRLLPSCALCLLAAASTATHASTITDLITFTASGQVAASGSYTLTFDPSLVYTDTTTGLTVNSFSDTFTSAIPMGFNYGEFGPGFLTIGGLLNGINSVHAGTNDFFVTFGGLTTSPYFGEFILAVSGQSNKFYDDEVGTVTVTTESTVTPEPSTLALLGTGLIGAVGLIRRRLAT